MPNTEELQKIEGLLASVVETIKKQGDDWMVQIKDMREDLESFENRLVDHAEMIRGLIQWRDSNGSPGAEDRLRCVYDKCVEIEKHKLPVRMDMAESNIRILQNVADSSVTAWVKGAVNDTLDKRSRTAVEIIKAWGPIVSAALAALAIVLAAVL